MNSHWSYLPLNLDHAVTQEEAGQYFSLRGATTDIAPKAGHFDIDNDGKPEYLAWLSAYSGAGQGCDIETFVELTPDRDHIKKSALSSLLSDHSCGEFDRAFRFDGKTYIENRRTVQLKGLDFSLPSILTRVSVIEGRHKRTVCTYKLDIPDEPES